MCLMFQLGVLALLWNAKKEKYLHEISMFAFTNFFFEAYLIWVSKLDVPKIGISLSKWS